MTSNDLYSDLKKLIFQVAAENEKIGPLDESIKWGEPSFTPLKKDVGSSVRLVQRDEGTRALVFSPSEEVPVEPTKTVSQWRLHTN